jgi:hypothetical protein
MHFYVYVRVFSWVHGNSPESALPLRILWNGDIKPTDIMLLVNWLGRYARVVDHLAVENIAQGVPLGGGSTLHPKVIKSKTK